jgi:hypothetical protein
MIAPAASQRSTLGICGLFSTSKLAWTMAETSKSMGGKAHKQVFIRTAIVNLAVPEKTSKNHCLPRSGASGTSAHVFQGILAWQSVLGGTSRAWQGCLAGLGSD